MPTRSLLLLFLLPLLTGCLSTMGGQTYASPDWQKSRGAAGKVLLIVAGSPQGFMAAEHNAEINQIAADALAHLPNTSVLAPATPATPATQPAPWSTEPSDAQAIAQAQAAGADSVCVLSIGQYSGVFMIGLSPLPDWRGYTHILYSLRLLDAHTGNLLTTATTSSTTGGEFILRTHQDLKQDLHRALQRDLTP